MSSLLSMLRGRINTGRQLMAPSPSRALASLLASRAAPQQQAPMRYAPVQQYRPAAQVQQYRPAMQMQRPAVGQPPPPPLPMQFQERAQEARNLLQNKKAAAAEQQENALTMIGGPGRAGGARTLNLDQFNAAVRGRAGGDNSWLDELESSVPKPSKKAPSGTTPKKDTPNTSKPIVSELYPRERASSILRGNENPWRDHSGRGIHQSAGKLVQKKAPETKRPSEQLVQTAKDKRREGWMMHFSGNHLAPAMNPNPLSQKEAKEILQLEKEWTKVEGSRKDAAERKSDRKSKEKKMREFNKDMLMRGTVPNQSKEVDAETLAGLPVDIQRTLEDQAVIFDAHQRDIKAGNTEDTPELAAAVKSLGLSEQHLEGYRNGSGYIREGDLERILEGKPRIQVGIDRWREGVHKHPADHDFKLNEFQQRLIRDPETRHLERTGKHLDRLIMNPKLAGLSPEQQRDFDMFLGFALDAEAEGQPLSSQDITEISSAINIPSTDISNMVEEAYYGGYVPYWGEGQEMGVDLSPLRRMFGQGAK